MNITLSRSVFFSMFVDIVIYKSVMSAIRRGKYEHVPVVKGEASRHRTPHILVLRKVRFYCELRYFCFRVAYSVLYQTVGLLLNRLVPVGSNNLTTGVDVFPFDVGLMACLSVMPPELSDIIRSYLRNRNPAGIGKHRTSDTIRIKIVVLRNTVVFPESICILSRCRKCVLREQFG